MELTEAVVVDFVRWWCHETAADGDALVTTDFEYDDGIQSLQREDFLASHRYAGPIEHLRIVDVWVSPGRAAVMFEGTDSVTDMRHRACFLMDLDGVRARKVRACFGRILDDQRPADSGE